METNDEFRYQTTVINEYYRSPDCILVWHYVIKVLSSNNNFYYYHHHHHHHVIILSHFCEPPHYICRCNFLHTHSSFLASIHFFLLILSTPPVMFLDGYIRDKPFPVITATQLIWLFAENLTTSKMVYLETRRVKNNHLR